ncbi:MAG: bifunctional DedA family/phosphatase PAP2 family protein [Pseudomonas sp.]|nr:bifunctional DedA family/phosphatase PAP2 family protein [Pseudomonas sp.]
MNDILTTILHWSASSPYWLGGAIFVVALLECLALVGIVLPGVVLLFALAAMSGSGALDLSSALLLAWLGGLSGDILSYALGRRLQHKVPQLPVLRHHPQWLINAQLHFHRYGTLSLLVGRFIGPLRPVLPLVAGMLSMPVVRFIVVSIFAAAGWAVAYIIPGWLVGAAHALNPPTDFWPQALWIASGLAGCGLLSVISCLRGWRTASLINACLSGLLLTILILNWPSLAVFDLYLHDLSQLIRTPWLDQSMVVITRLGDTSTQVIVSFILCTLLLFLRQFQSLFFAASTLLITAVSNYLLKHLFERARPSVLLEPLQSFSFPSGHSASGFAFFLVLGVLASRQQPQRWRVFWLLLAFIPATCIALSRVYLTAHWPTDTIAGALLASLICAASLAVTQHQRPIPALTKQSWQIILPILLVTCAVLLSWNLPQVMRLYAY